ncbi:helix-turn-helix transcriptional regulator [Streptomyces sp. SID8111]|uniref:helix-turn-helix domain-containing protein n=1 Tax=Streptomyces sp. SID8111 TaxID=2706100 RepID=UPI0013C26545|nr:helix-turn-helix transcriptional regulator [Streptomyces sp. SID8111]NEC25165.1 helix-turn-helix transcriptional regulator [Streptomyces sp. SID8111]
MSFDAKALRRAALERGDTTAAAIARRTGIPYATVVRWTSGRGIPAGPALATLERTYGVTAAGLFPVDA